jgi:hypothetical protein
MFMSYRTKLCLKRLIRSHVLPTEPNWFEKRDDLERTERLTMKTAIPLLLAGLVCGMSQFTFAASTNVSLTIPATADPWLAGMPAGTVASADHPQPGLNPATLDVVPAQSPVEVSDLHIVPGELLTFDASGLIAHGNVPPDSEPEGGEAGNDAVTAHNTGAENGMSDILAPFNALLGVFLSPSPPDSSSAPSRLDFGSSESRKYSILAPALQQVFFIGAGHRSNGDMRRILVPAGATRLYLGVMDSCAWNDNTGSFTVKISASRPSITRIAPIKNFALYPGIWVTGTPGKLYRVERSDRLDDSTVWSTVVEGILSVSPQLFLDPNGKNSEHCFYRAVELQ